MPFWKIRMDFAGIESGWGRRSPHLRVLTQFCNSSAKSQRKSSIILQRKVCCWVFLRFKEKRILWFFSSAHVRLISNKKLWFLYRKRASQLVPMIKNPPATVGDTRNADSIPGLGRFPGEGHSNPLQYSSKIHCYFSKKEYFLKSSWWHRFAFLSVLYRKSLLNDLSVQFRSVTQSCPTLCNPMNRSTPGLPVHHQLPEFTQTHVHQVGDAIQPFHPLSSPNDLYLHNSYYIRNYSISFSRVSLWIPTNTNTDLTESWPSP